MTDAPTDWAWRQEQLRGSAKFVLLAIARRVQQAAEAEEEAAGQACTLTKRDLVGDTGMENRTITGALEELKSAGLVDIAEAGGWKRRVTLQVDR